MADLAIRAENLGKLYRIGERGVQYLRLTESLANAVAAPFRRLRGQADPARSESRRLWALRELDLEVPEGQVLGVIGHNGAGKTTLLKLLSRITEPTEGLAVLRGRVGSLLEVGTGFHAELTGRENIFLNGAILGMRRAETVSKFDEIVAFAEIERFIDTPVKRYSTGMYFRLAFAVAAHLDPDILIVDEVLAVGDSAFQAKCLGRMQDVSKTGRTVLFVSHNMATVTGLCDRAVLLESGRLVADGAPTDVVQQYLASSGGATLDLSASADRDGDGRIRITGLTLARPDGEPVGHIQTGDPLCIVLNYEVTGPPLRNVLVTVSFDTIYGDRVVVLRNDYAGTEFNDVAGRGRFVCAIDSVPLISGLYPAAVDVTVNGELADAISEAVLIRVDASDYYGTGRYPERGRILLPHAWSVEAG